MQYAVCMRRAMCTARHTARTRQCRTHCTRDHARHATFNTQHAAVCGSSNEASPRPHLHRDRLGSPLPHLHRDWVEPTPATSAPGPGLSRPHLHRGRAHPSLICIRTGLTPATSVPGPTCLICTGTALSSPLPQLHRDWARPCLICTETGSPLPHLHRDGLAPATSAPGLSSPLPQLHRDWARPCHICAGTGLAGSEAVYRTVLTRHWYGVLGPPARPPACAH
jgi:hypothetical protein